MCGSCFQKGLATAFCWACTASERLARSTSISIQMTGYQCDTCGWLCASGFRLWSHMRLHRWEWHRHCHCPTWQTTERERKRENEVILLLSDMVKHSEQVAGGDTIGLIIISSSSSLVVGTNFQFDLTGSAWLSKPKKSLVPRKETKTKKTSKLEIHVLFLASSFNRRHSMIVVDVAGTVFIFSIPWGYYWNTPLFCRGGRVLLEDFQSGIPRLT